jgi:hypothetical protein
MTVDGYLAALPANVRPAAEALRDVLDSVLTHADGRLRRGHPVWTVDGAPVAGFRAHRRHVTFLVWRGPWVDTAVRVCRTADIPLATFTALLAEAETGLLAA